MTTANIAADLLPLAQPIDTLHEMPGNPRRGDIEAVARSYERFGQRKPIVARRDGTVIAGNHQLKAARRLGWDRIAVIYTDDDDTTAKAYALADNRMSDLGTYDEVLLTQLIDEVAVTPELLAAAGFDVDLKTADDLDLSRDEPDEESSGPLKPLTRTFFLVSAPLKRHAEIHDLLTAALAGEPEVTLDSAQS